jgi:hypothetical protein
MRKYADILRQLGFKDDQGNFIPGTVEADAQRQRLQLLRNIGLAEEEVTKSSQQQGTLFSGVRATNTARAQHPFISQMGELDVMVPRQLMSLWEQAGGTLQDYAIQNNMLLADAAQRKQFLDYQNSLQNQPPPPSGSQQNTGQPGQNTFGTWTGQVGNNGFYIYNGSLYQNGAPVPLAQIPNRDNNPFAQGSADYDYFWKWYNQWVLPQLRLLPAE